MGVFLLSMAFMFAMVSVHYTGLTILAAGLRMPLSEGFRIDDHSDWQVLQDKRASVVICGVPIEMKEVLSAMRIVFISSIVATIWLTA